MKPHLRLRVTVATLGSVALLALLLAGAAVPATAATTSQCQAVVEGLQQHVTAANASGVEPNTPAADRRAVRVGEEVAAASQQYPQCEAAIDEFVDQLASSARRSAVVKGTPFWGPIGWAWNTVYYKVFGGGDIMMAMFGWALLLSPFILLFSLDAVLRGSRGAFRRPHVPEHLRTTT